MRWRYLRHTKKLVQRRAQARAKIEDPLLYWLLYEYIFRHFNVGPFRIFRYLTFRTAFASLTALFMALIIGPSVIRRLREFQIGQYIREEGPRSHQKKAGTPTMGGLLIVVSIVLPTLLWSDLSNKFVWLVVLSTLVVRRHWFCGRLSEGCAQTELTSGIWTRSGSITRS